jgi:hypothetical protein
MEKCSKKLNNPQNPIMEKLSLFKILTFFGKLQKNKNKTLWKLMKIDFSSAFYSENFSQ